MFKKAIILVVILFSATFILSLVFAEETTVGNPGSLDDRYDELSDRGKRPKKDLPVDARRDVQDRREDIKDIREDIRDRKEDIYDRRHQGGKLDRLEDIRDRREDIRDRREDARDRREDRWKRHHDIKSRREGGNERREHIDNKGNRPGHDRGIRDHGAGIGAGRGQGGIRRPEGVHSKPVKGSGKRR